jgi:hypothetical protein
MQVTVRLSSFRGCLQRSHCLKVPDLSKLSDAQVTQGHRDMVAETSTRGSDEHLESILYETANWTVNGAHGVVLCEVVTLRLAFEKAAQFAARGRKVVALMRSRPPEIVVLSGQLRKLMNLLVESGVSPETGVKASINEIIGGFDNERPILIPHGAGGRDATVTDTI